MGEVGGVEAAVKAARRAAAERQLQLAMNTSHRGVDSNSVGSYWDDKGTTSLVVIRIS